MHTTGLRDDIRCPGLYGSDASGDRRAVPALGIFLAMFMDLILDYWDKIMAMPLPEDFEPSID